MGTFEFVARESRVNAARSSARLGKFEEHARSPTASAPSSMQRKAGCSCGGGCPSCSSKSKPSAVSFNGQSGRDPIHFFSGKGEDDCAPTWYGDTSPEIDPSGGSFTGKLIRTYNDPMLKDPCVRECVEEHEAVHVRDLTPIVKKIHDCDAAAGDDWNKKGKCNAMATKELSAARARSECEAYQKSFTCLTLKVLDPSSPCSKSPHREEVQKHRGYDGCALKKNCADAGIPHAGIPNS